MTAPALASHSGSSHCVHMSETGTTNIYFTLGSQLCTNKKELMYNIFAKHHLNVKQIGTKIVSERETERGKKGEKRKYNSHKEQVILKIHFWKEETMQTSSSSVKCLLPLLTGKPLPNSLEWMSAPYSTVTSSSILLTNRQNSLSTSSVGTI